MYIPPGFAAKTPYLSVLDAAIANCQANIISKVNAGDHKSTSRTTAKAAAS